MTAEAQYLVGIDLGTSNCAMAFAEPGAGSTVADFKIVQLQRPGVLADQLLLPSSVYVASPHEFPEDALRLPWGVAEPIIVGECARWQGARAPGRLITSAKSWLCHDRVDRQAPILPWAATEDVQKLSPVEVSARLLAHMAAVWDQEHPNARFADQEVVITVPASFDEVARALTVAAARKAGLSRFTLLEEPQAAFYDFTGNHRERLARALEGIRLILVVDVGGGTTDLTLIQALPGQDSPELRRIAVGEHLILGGDNMDAALARLAEEKMLAGRRKLSVRQWGQLIEMARQAKEALLNPSGPDHFNLSVSAEGSRLVGGSLSARIAREEAQAVITEGFFPRCSATEMPSRGGRVALQEMGLPYASDPAITRHIAAFLKTHASAGQAALGTTARVHTLPRPDAILLNGGVFKSEALADRLVEVVSSWWPDASRIPVLGHSSLDLAVARGAALYGLVRHGQGKRISGGAAHALYVGLEKKGAAQPMALCLIPRGQEEGEMVDLGQQPFRLAVGKPVQFPLYSTASDHIEKAGEVVPVGEDMQPLPPIHTILKAAGKQMALLPVHLSARLTEIGTLELWCVSESGKDRWRLEFELRAGAAEESTTVTESMPAGFAEARALVEQIYSAKGHKPTTPEPAVKQLWSRLERTLGARESWRVPVLRELWGVLYAGAGKRRKSAEHERIFFQLLGYVLRPGFGYPLDPWRCEQTMQLFAQGVHFTKEKPVWNEFWVLWRRISGGLNEHQQQAIWEAIKDHLEAKLPLPGIRSQGKPKGAHAEGLDEMVRLGATLEHISPLEKIEFGSRIAARLKNEARAGGPLTWALGRVGARVPLTGTTHKTVPPGVAAEWASLLLEPKVLALEGALFALTQLTRMSGDRARDVEAAIREKVLQTLTAANAPDSWRKMVTEVVELQTEDRARAMGDTLPAGLSVH